MLGSIYCCLYITAALKSWNHTAQKSMLSWVANQTLFLEKSDLAMETNTSILLQLIYTIALYLITTHLQRLINISETYEMRPFAGSI